jgi:hypothetical protein
VSLHELTRVNRHAHNRPVTLPPELLQAITDEAGGKVALIVGAGCSLEAPTELPLSRELSEDAYRRLLADHVLEPGDCGDPADLSSVADVVFEKTDGQAQLVSRFPLTRFKNASPNVGYLIAAALLREHAIRDLLNLNFDLAAQHSLSAVNAGSEVGIVRGPQDLPAAGVVNLVHLHRDAYADPDEWILRTVQLEDAWRDGWEELVATRVMTVPVVVFAGLGTAADVLMETVGRIRRAIADHVSIHVDPGAFGSSEFTEALAISQGRYVQTGWTAFMSELAERVAAEQLARLRVAVSDFEKQNELGEEDNEQVLAVLEQFTLLELGGARARWLLLQDAYVPARTTDVRLLADLVQAASILARELSLVLVAESEGRLQMRREGVVLGILVPASGSGALDWARFDVEVLTSRSMRRASARDPVVVLAAGVVGDRELAPPEDLVDELPDDSMLRPIVIDVTQLRHDPVAALGALR